MIDFMNPSIIKQLPVLEYSQNVSLLILQFYTEKAFSNYTTEYYCISLHIKSSTPMSMLTH